MLPLERLTLLPDERLVEPEYAERAADEEREVVPLLRATEDAPERVVVPLLRATEDAPERVVVPLLRATELLREVPAERVVTPLLRVEELLATEEDLGVALRPAAELRAKPLRTAPPRTPKLPSRWPTRAARLCMPKGLPPPQP